MKFLRILAVAAVLVVEFIGSAQAISLYVDAAPNVYGSPDYAAWLESSKAAAVNGTFVNMQHSADTTNIGTQNFAIQDAVVYSFGDLGKRLHFMYWIPNTTVAQLAGNFQMSILYQWDGVTYDYYNDNYGQTWIQPSSWTNYNGGVIGTAGFAWWSQTPAELANDYAAWDAAQGNITFYTRLNDETTAITAYHPDAVPEPSTVALLGFGIAGLGLAKYRKKKAHQRA